jgi:NAD+ synthetase
VEKLVSAGAKAILNLSASPFQLGKPSQRETMIKNQALRHGVPFYYCNAVGGNDELVFDGHSLAISAEGEVETRLPGFEESTRLVSEGYITPDSHRLEDLRRALVLGVRDYARKCGFRSAVLGLSGGIDSAVVACLAVEALGADKVTGVAMPSPFSSSHSVEDALSLAKNLGIKCLTIPIGESFEVFKKQMRPVFDDLPEDATEENMQARLRGLTLMSLSNKFGHLLLTTGNKSELAVGYCTLYGDMAGGLAAISDVPKTLVYELAEYLNREREIIPRRTIDKPPSAELRPDQTDQDTLPPYDVLDGILKLYVEKNLGVDEIVSAGFDAETVRWVTRKVDFNEYKREQAAPGLKMTSRAFGMGRRMPIAQKFFLK